MNINEIDLNKTVMVHHIDFDGWMPYILSIYFQINCKKFIPTNYDENTELDVLLNEEYNTVIYVDFTPSESVRKVITERNMRCLIIDHHESVYEEINEFCKNYNNAEYIYAIDKCGTKLYYEWLKEQGYIGTDVSEYLVELTNTYDLYQKESFLWKEASDCNRLLYSTGKYYIKDDRRKCFETFINSMLWKLRNMKKFKFVGWELEKIQADINKENELFESIVRNASKEISTRKDSKGNYFAIFTCNSKISTISSRILEKYKSLKYVIVINQYDIDKPRISLRSKDFDLLQLNYCKGHVNACGISEEEIFDVKEFVRKLKSKEIYELGYKV